ncbi:MAG TPA: YsnF/AvaK domain-containing protein [Acidimicrobiales bacterium]|jgi:uncharacterized protein (TIGR02271 family)|nr:YsnF/AvaK domain-containing protein [Acidimicrobiales bacterium]
MYVVGDHRWVGSELFDSSGETVGQVKQVRFSPFDQRPEWLVVGGGGLLGPRGWWVPVAGVRQVGDQLITNFSAEAVKSAPHPRSVSDSGPERADAVALCEYYGTVPPEPAEPLDRTTSTPVRSRQGDDSDSDGAMTRSEEELLVGRAVRPAEKVRLVKRVVIEEAHIPVRLRREELIVERIPYQAGSPPESEVLGELEEADQFVGEIVLFEERAVVTTQVVPLERVRLTKTVVTEEQTIYEQLRKERIDVEQETLP